MRVLHVIPAVAPRYGGPSEAAIRMVEALRAEGVDALLAATDADGPGRLPVATHTVSVHCGAKTIFFPRLPGESLKLSPALARWLRRNASGFDVLHVHSVFSHPSLVAGAAARAASVPYVVRPLGQLDRWSLSQHAFRKRLFLAAGGRRFLEGAAALHWTDASEAAAVPDPGWCTQGFVVPLGVNDGLFDEQPVVSRRRVVLFLSRLHPKKNVEGLVDAFLAAGEPGAGWRLVVAGEGEESYVRELRRRAEGGIAEGRVEFVGWLEGEKKVIALREASFLALPSHQENFGIAVAEAMAAGTPVVVTEGVALAREISRVGAGWVVREGQEGLREVLSEAMSSEAELRRRGEAARMLAAKEYRWAAVAESLVREYEAILERARGRG